MHKVALLFSGQSSQYIGMGKDLYNHYEFVKKVYEEANDILGFNIKNIIFDGNEKELKETANTQVSILLTSYIVFLVYKEENACMPDYSAGHSLGEITALLCSEALTFPEALKLVKKRGDIMQNSEGTVDCGMISVSGIEYTSLEEEVIKYNTVIACYNSPKQYVVSGKKTDLEKLTLFLQQSGAKVIPLKVNAAFHSPYMKVAGEKFLKELKKINFQDPKWPIISNVTGLPYNTGSCVIDMLKTHITSPVKWIDTMNYFKKNNITKFVGIGPGKTTVKLLKDNIEYADAVCFQKLDDIENILKIKNWKNVSEEIKELLLECKTLAVSTRNLCYDKDIYEQEVIKPYQKLEELIYKDSTFTSYEYSKNDGLMGLDLLKQILAAKKVSEEEQERKIKKIIGQNIV